MNAPPFISFTGIDTVRKFSLLIIFMLILDLDFKHMIFVSLVVKNVRDALRGLSF